MNVRLQYDTEFQAGIHYLGALQLNNYNVVMTLMTGSSDSVKINVAMERLRTFIDVELADVVFIAREHENEAELLYSLGVNVCTLPEEPVDQIIGLMLYCKLNAIMEGHLVIVSLDIKSKLGDEVWYQHDEEESLGPFANDGWWHRNSTQKETLELDATADNVVRVQSTGWKEYGLEWPEETKENKAKVIFPKFKRDENEQSR